MPYSLKLNALRFKSIKGEWLLFHPRGLLPSHDHWKRIDTTTNTGENKTLRRYHKPKY